ncbi:hypothetical protein [Rickettsiales endosymbiont of Stachyamoeba lipophora]|uniref:hypothetical protein n=1 Tax=Rickettsiales endosymbiont of Stachyamoeba lipophora TaxID=2486578 RepID=UPI000F650FC2|nr:hypothetical protein [Rickettsiales endosymbiont of Stachyamoeba lipophora]AZL15270.1 hypothetical protein EF513_01695 [Rickettsiales endosymbiont of Stachyamoeba lipophora]
MRKSNNPKGRPRSKTILTQDDKDAILCLAAMNCTKEGIRQYLGLSNDAFYRVLLKEVDTQAILQKGYALRNCLIRMKQMEVAMNGNVQMLIHLGKSELGQTYNKHQIASILSNNTISMDSTTLQKIARTIIKNDCL